MRWPTIEANNRYYNGLFFVGSAIVGSLSSVLLHVALVWAIVRLSIRSFPLTTTRAALIVAVVMASLPAAELLAVLVNGRGMEGWLEVLGQVAFLATLPVLSRLMVSSPRDVLDDCALAAAAGGGLLLGISLVQFAIVGLLRAEAGLGNAGVMSVIALLFACVALCGTINADDRRRTILVIGAACACGALLLSGMRAVIATAPIAVFFVLLMLRGTGVRAMLRGPGRYALLVVGIALAAAVPMLFERAGLAANAITQIIETGETENVSLGQRVDLWKAALPFIAQSPIFGHGPDAARELIESIPAKPRMHFSHFHNFVLNALVRGGLVELAAVIAIPVGLVLVAWRRRQTPPERAGRALLLVIPIIFYVPGLTGKLFDHDIMNAFFVYAVILGLRLLHTETTVSRPYRPQTG
jgi:O-antigen ligase